MGPRYEEFLASKKGYDPAAGITAGLLPPALKPFQVRIVEWALWRGRCAIFAGTGLGKTLQQLTWASEIRRHTGKPVIILTPLAVAQQTVAEAVKFGIGGVAYARDQSEATSKIVVTNYDRIEKFDLSQYGGIVLDESSIIKAHESQTRRKLIELCRDIPYRLCCTATPAPNDYVELGNHAEFLGICSQKEMLATWFIHDGSIRATNGENHGAKPTAEWRLKGHAQREFWRWVSTWAVMIRHPKDMGYEEPGYDLPPLIKKQVLVPVEYKPSAETGLLFPMEASTLSERIGAKRDSIDARVKAAADIVAAHPDRPWLIWCHLNKESEAIAKLIPGASEVRGDQTPELKTERLISFAHGGGINILVSKPKIAGLGMNLQRCSDMIFVGLNDSFEQLYQAIRRCWRFGQTKPVTAYLIASELEGAVVANLDSKERDADRMADAMLEFMRDLGAKDSRPSKVISVHNKPMGVPQWLAA